MNRISDKVLERRYKLEEYYHNKNYESSYLFYDGINANPKYGNSLLIIIELNLLNKSAGINLNISDEALILNVGKIYSLELSMPYKINSKISYSYFDTEKRILYIILPFYEKDIEEFSVINSNEKDKNIKINLCDDYVYDVII
jgi:hypothetical protein